MSTTTPLTATDLAEARLIGERAFYPHRLSFAARDRGGALRMRLRAHDLSADVTVGQLGYRATVRLECGELRSGYQINLPVRGSARSRCGTQSTVASPDCAAVFTPEQDSAIERWDADCVQLGVRMSSRLVGEILDQCGGRLSGAPVPFRHDYPIDTGPRHAWVGLVASALELMEAFPGAGGEQLRAHLARSIAVAFLHSADHGLREELDRPGAAPRPKVLRRAIQAIEEDPAAPLDLAALAGACGVSVRTLQYEFARHLGIGPSGYRRRIALELAHLDLVGADPAVTSVADVACRWGFFHLGRFAREHQQRYGTRPSEVLRGDG